jgi:aryl-alcohol dehydrogenase-like predicted oxidoreductase
MLTELIRDRAWATEKGTARFAKRHAKGKTPDAYREIARMTLSALGIGTYLGEPTDEVDARYTDAIEAAVRAGINVIDTASNYRGGRSERCVGEALQRLFASREIYRSEVLIASKAGFVTPKTMALAPDSETSCRCHCMAPDYLSAVIDQSLAALQLETIDVYYLHNPECQLQELPRETVYERIRAGFEALERAADAGKIRVYGVATWSGLRATLKDDDHLCLADLVALAEDVAGKQHRFKAVQMPLNRAMPEAHNLANQLVDGDYVSTLAAAAHFGMVSFASGPLYQGRFAVKGRATAALRSVMDAPGVTTTLTGMSQVAHVHENVTTMSES